MNFKLLVISLMMMLILSVTAFAQTTDVATNTWLEGLMNFLVGFGSSNPKVVPVFALLYLVGLGLKIARSAYEEFILATPSTKDNERYAKAKENKIIKGVFFVMDLLIRLKSPAK